MSHRIQDAMNRRELDEEEAFFVLRYAGHLGYSEAIKRLRPWSPLKRMRRWLVWFGGWESPELCQWDLGKPAFRINGSPTPLSFFGHRVTVHRFGVDIDLPRRRTRLCVHWERGAGVYVYISPDCTPSSATHWLFGRKATR
jgi:hypothetical protein